MFEYDTPHHLSRSVWILAVVGAVVIHACCVALALGAMHSDASDTDLGAPAIEIGVALMSPRLDPIDLPVGPDTEASAPSPAIAEQKAVLKPSELPKAVPNETDDPDRLVSLSNTTNPENDDPKIAAMQTQASEQSIAAEATAMPTIATAQESTRSVAPSLGTGESARRERVTWEKELAAHFNKFKRYPADRSMKAAEVVVSFVLDRLGHVLSTHVVKGSGDTSFDDAAIAMLQRSDPVPPPPPLVADEGLTFTLPVIFHVKDQK